MSRFLKHLASWGFIVVGNTDKNTGLGYSAEWGLELMDKLAADRKSVFFQKIDEENLGIGGHSQGGVGAVKNGIDSEKAADVLKRSSLFRR